MDTCCKHAKLRRNDKSEYYLFTWSIPIVFSISDLNVDTYDYEMKNGYTYRAILHASQEKITFTICSKNENLKCSVSMYIGSQTLLFSNSLNKPTRQNNINYCQYFDLVTFSPEDECFKKLKLHPNETLNIICRIIYLGNTYIVNSQSASAITSTDSLNNLKALATALKNSAELLAKEKVILRVGEESVTVNKAVLCARSSVFAKMFQNDMRELSENTVIVTDIKFEIVKALVSFLYAGKLQKYDFSFLCDLYYASDKYDIGDLRQLCVDFLIHKISKDNAIQVLKFALSHNDARLKSAALGFIATNIESWIFTNEWENLINDEPQIAGEVLNFFDF